MGTQGLGDVGHVKGLLRVLGKEEQCAKALGQELA